MTITGPAESITSTPCSTKDIPNAKDNNGVQQYHRITGLMSGSHRWPRPWAFGLLILPVAVYVGFTATPLPSLLSRAGVSVFEIGTIGSILQLPNILVFLWAPLVDVRLQTLLRSGRRLSEGTGPRWRCRRTVTQSSCLRRCHTRRTSRSGAIARTRIIATDRCCVSCFSNTELIWHSCWKRF